LYLVQLWDAFQNTSQPVTSASDRVKLLSRSQRRIHPEQQSIFAVSLVVIAEDIVCPVELAERNSRRAGSHYDDRCRRRSGAQVGQRVRAVHLQEVELDEQHVG
jgi:hypothetical protein